MRFLIVWLIFLTPLLTGQSTQCVGFKLITTLYNEKNESRLLEYVTCLEKNLAHDLIATIHVIYDTSKDNKDDKQNKLLTYLKKSPIKISYTHGRPSYGDCFELANTLYPNSRIILSNADIYFNETLNLLNNYILTKKFIALTRWNILKNGSLELFKQYNNKGIFLAHNSARSQDTWIFETPCCACGHNVQIGILGCDAAIVAEALNADFTVLNPCLSIQCCHLHLSNIRNYPNLRPYPGYTKLCVPWGTIENSSPAKKEFAKI